MIFWGVLFIVLFIYGGRADSMMERYKKTTVHPLISIKWCEETIQPYLESGLVAYEHGISLFWQITVYPIRERCLFDLCVRPEHLLKVEDCFRVLVPGMSVSKTRNFEPDSLIYTLELKDALSAIPSDDIRKTMEAKDSDEYEYADDYDDHFEF